MKGRDRAFEVHVQVRDPTGTGEGMERLEAVGIDHGIVHPRRVQARCQNASNGRWDRGLSDLVNPRALTSTCKVRICDQLSFRITIREMYMLMSGEMQSTTPYRQ